MSFVSFAFLILLSIVLFFRLLLQNRRFHSLYLVILMIASLIFYAWHIPIYLFVFLFNTTFDYFAAQVIQSQTNRHNLRKLCLIGSIIVNLGLLAVFKYYHFFLDNINQLLISLHLHEPLIDKLDLILPLGISFYTFQSLSLCAAVCMGPASVGFGGTRGPLLSI